MSDRPTTVLFMQSQDYFGADSMVHALIMRHLDRREFDVHVACTKGADGTDAASLTALRGIDDLHVRPTAFGPTLNSRSMAQIGRQVAGQGVAATVDLTRLVAYCRRHRVDIIHGTEKPRDAFYGYLLARAVGARCLTHLHVKAEDWISGLSQLAMRRGDGLIGVSDFVSRSLTAMGFPAAKVHTVRNAIDVAAWTPDPTAADDVRREFEVPDDVPLLLTASRLFPWKGQRLLLDALAEVTRAGRPFHLLVVGEDDPRATPGGGSYLAELTAAATALGIAGHVTFTGYRTDVRRLMNACDVFAMPSFEEPFGIVFTEAMALGKPVVALDNGGTPEVVDHPTTGLLSGPDDVTTLAHNIGRLLDSPALRAELGAAGRRRVASQFNPRRLAEDVAAVYRTVLRGHRRGQGRVPSARSGA